MEKNKSVLFLSPFFYPEEISTGKYNTYLVKELVKQGVDVDVVSSFPFYPEWAPRNTDLTVDGVRIVRGGLGIKYPSSQIFKRVLLEVWYSFHVGRYLLKKRNEIGEVIVVFPPVFFMFVVSVLLPKKIKKTGIVHDLQGVMAKADSSIFRSVVSAVMLGIERRAFAKMDKLICLSRSMCDILVMDYKVDKNALEISYPFVTSIDSAVETNELDKLFSSELIHVVYSGALGEKQKPLELLELFKEVSVLNADIRCHIISKGPVFEELKLACDKESYPVVFHDLVPEELLDELYLKSALQLIPQAPGTGAGAFPSKLPNLLFKGVPVFAICDEGSELDSLLDQFEFCKVSYHWDIKLLATELVDYVGSIESFSHSVVKEKNHLKLEKLFGVKELVNILLR